MDALCYCLSHEKRLTVNMNNINQSENINIQFNKASQTNVVDEHIPLASTPSAAGAAQFLINYSLKRPECLPQNKC